MSGMPTRDEFTAPNEVIVHQTSDATPDEFGRTRFVAYWPTNQKWVPSGVRGQVFFTDLSRFVAEQEAEGRKVRVEEVDR